MQGRGIRGDHQPQDGATPRAKESSAMGNSLPVESKFTFEEENDRIKYVVSSMQGWGEKMEDAHAAILNLDDTTSTSFFGVYDGHGGAEVALYCAKQFHIELCNHEDYHNDLINALDNVFLSMDENLQQSDAWRELVIPHDNGCMYFLKAGVCAKPFPQATYTGPAYEGSTACVVVIRGNQMIVGHVGDSRCVLSRQGGLAIDLSFDHKPCTRTESERERVQNAGGRSLGLRCEQVMGNYVVKEQWLLGDFGGGVTISRSIGDFAFKKNKDLDREKQMLVCDPDILADDITDDMEFLVIASQGLWSCVDSADVVSYIHDRLSVEGAELRVICEEVVEFGLASGENTTVILVQFKPGAFQYQLVDPAGFGTAVSNIASTSAAPAGASDTSDEGVDDAATARPTVMGYDADSSTGSADATVDSDEVDPNASATADSYNPRGHAEIVASHTGDEVYTSGSARVESGELAVPTPSANNTVADEVKVDAAVVSGGSTTAMAADEATVVSLLSTIVDNYYSINTSEEVDPTATVAADDKVTNASTSATAGSKLHTSDSSLNFVLVEDDGMCHRRSVVPEGGWKKEGGAAVAPARSTRKRRRRRERRAMRAPTIPENPRLPNSDENDMDAGGEEAKQERHLVLAHELFLLSRPDLDDLANVALRSDALDAVKSDGMAPLFESLATAGVLLKPDDAAARRDARADRRGGPQARRELFHNILKHQKKLILIQNEYQYQKKIYLWMGHAGREEEEEGVCSMGTTSHRTGHSWSVGSAARDNPTAEMRPVQAEGSVGTTSHRMGPLLERWISREGRSDGGDASGPVLFWCVLIIFAVPDAIRSSSLRLGQVAPRLVLFSNFKAFRSPKFAKILPGSDLFSPRVLGFRTRVVLLLDVFEVGVKASSAMGNSLPVESKVTVEEENDRIKYIVSSMQGLGHKMEDAHAAILSLDDTTSTSFFGVYDGHGGAEVASYCAKRFHIELCNHEDYHNDLTNALDNVFFSMDENLQQSDAWRELVIPRDNGWMYFLKAGVCANFWPFPQAYTGPAYEGSTACVVVIRGDQMIVGHAGDSRCVLSRQGGLAIDLSSDHKPRTSESERERVQNAGGISLGVDCEKVMENYVIKEQWILSYFGESVTISRSIGDFAFKQNKDLNREEQMLICDPDIHTEGVELRVICEELVQSGLPSGENTTVILVQFKPGAFQYQLVDPAAFDTAASNVASTSAGPAGGSDSDTSATSDEGVDDTATAGTTTTGYEAGSSTGPGSGGGSANAAFDSGGDLAANLDIATNFGSDDLAANLDIATDIDTEDVFTFINSDDTFGINSDEVELDPNFRPKPQVRRAHDGPSPTPSEIEADLNASPTRYNMRDIFEAFDKVEAELGGFPLQGHDVSSTSTNPNTATDTGSGSRTGDDDVDGAIARAMAVASSVMTGAGYEVDSTTTNPSAAADTGSHTGDEIKVDDSTSGSARGDSGELVNNDTTVADNNASGVADSTTVGDEVDPTATVAADDSNTGDKVDPPAITKATADSNTSGEVDVDATATATASASAAVADDEGTAPDDSEGSPELRAETGSENLKPAYGILQHRNSNGLKLILIQNVHELYDLGTNAVSLSRITRSTWMVSGQSHSLGRNTLFCINLSLVFLNIVVYVPVNNACPSNDRIFSHSIVSSLSLTTWTGAPL
uniref:protein-serine/threonine phosphatase n=1 Tax=Oryza nivara TaxID=4536 RepID=A0A0E0GIM8_ORYNI